MYRIIYIAFLLITTFANCQTYTGSILRVIDGDTFVFQNSDGSFKVRMYGIDAPEYKQEYGQESKNFLKKYEGKNCTVIQKDIDKYGRIVAVLMIDTTNINKLSLKQGYSWHYKKYSKDIDYSDCELYARKNKLGLWNSLNPLEPWIYRKTH